MERASRAGRLILVRHGESHWNVKGGTRFTGWADIPMTQLGRKQAVACGKLLASIPGLSFDAVFTSLLRRATQTYELIADNMPFAHARKNVRVAHSWRLNERHYGALVGLSKDEAEKQLGRDKVMGWRRSWDLRPPPMGDPRDNLLANPTNESPLYDWESEIWTKAITVTKRPVMRGSESIVLTEKSVDENAMIPKSESLKDCAYRVLPLWKDDILPRLVYGQTVLLVGHSNTIRGMVKFMDNISDENITSVVIPSAIPLIYTFEIDPNNSALIKPVGEKSSIGTYRYLPIHTHIYVCILKILTGFIDFLRYDRPVCSNEGIDRVVIGCESEFRTKRELR